MTQISHKICTLKEHTVTKLMRGLKDSRDDKVYVGTWRKVSNRVSMGIGFITVGYISMDEKQLNLPFKKETEQLELPLEE